MTKKGVKSSVNCKHYLHCFVDSYIDRLFWWKNLIEDLGSKTHYHFT
jgi:hypothetical protein